MSHCSRSLCMCNTARSLSKCVTDCSLSHSCGHPSPGYRAVCSRRPLLVSEREDGLPLWRGGTLPEERVEPASDGEHQPPVSVCVCLLPRFLLLTIFCVPCQKSVPCDLCKEVLVVVEQLLKDNKTEVRAASDDVIRGEGCV